MNPYDELPYRSMPIEWSAPERLAMASTLHGGPRAPVDEYRALELGCADGANLLPLAYFRDSASFVGVDGARSQIELARARRLELKLSNIEFVHADFLSADARLTGQFDYILAHGIFSWVPHDVRDALLALCTRRLRPGGLLYLNYNTRPGWNVRGLVRDFLLAHSAAAGTGLPQRAQRAQDVAAKAATLLASSGHPYSLLLADEFRFVCGSHASYVAHEFLAEDNHAYWRKEFLALARTFGLEYVADADFNYAEGRAADVDLLGLTESALFGPAELGAADLLSYRQLHTPILTLGPLILHPVGDEEFSNLVMASSLAACDATGRDHPTFRHSNGYEVEAKEPVIEIALRELQSLWPRGRRIDALFADVSRAMPDILLLHRNGLIELRCAEPSGARVTADPLCWLDSRCADHVTSPYHTLKAVEASPGADRSLALGASRCGL